MTPSATTRIWQEFGEQLKSFIAKRVSNEQNAADILQDVFLKIHANIERLNDETRLQAWIYQIARNTLIDHYRRHKVTAAIADEVADPEDGSGNSAVLRISDSLKGMVQLLPKKYREAIWLTEFQGITQVALAKRLGISVSGAKSRVQRGRQLLKKMLLECCHFEFDRRGTIIDYHPISCDCCASCSGS